MCALANTQLHLVDSVDDASELLRWLSTKTKIAIDTETTGLDVRRDQVRLVQVGDAQHGWAIPWTRWGGVVEDLVKRFEGEYVMHNAAYDQPIIEQSCGIKLPRHRIHDTRIMCHVLRPDLSTALKKAASYYVDPAANMLARALDDALRSAGWTWETVPIEFQPYWSYGALDTVLTYQLDDVVRPKVMDEAPAAYDLERAATWVCADMSRRGIRVDRAYTEERYAAFMRYCDEVSVWCEKHYGVKPGANAAVIARLAEDGIEFSKETASGAISLDKEVLGGITHPLAEAVLSRRQVQKVASTYLKNFLALADEDDVLHPRINTLGFNQDDTKRGGLGVRTGRMSMDKPNLQNLSRATEDESAANVVRRCLVARPDHTLLMIDFDQIEARLIADLTDDPGFISAFGQGDFFTNITREMWNDPAIEKKDPRRQSTKNAIYARAYGAGPPKFAVTAGITEEQARTLYARLDQLYPGWQQFTKQVEATARQRQETEGTPYVKSRLTGRRHVAPEDKLYVLVNYLVQGTAAEIFKMKLVELAQAGLDQFMCVPVHDEIISDVPTGDLIEVAHVASKIMNDDTLLSVPITASPSIGPRWGDKKELTL